MRADRLLSIMMLLQARGRMTTAALAAELEVSRRTILRDIDALSMAGIPVYAEGGHGGGVTLDEAYRTTLTGLKEQEARALFVAGGAGLLSQLGLGDAAATAQYKLAGALPHEHQAAVHHMRQRIYIDPLWWWHESEPLAFWQELQEAVQTDRRIRMRYETYQGEAAEREVEPYSLVAKTGAWYLVARRDGVFKTYRVTRIQWLTVLDTHFQRDPAFDLIAHWEASLDTFRDEFALYAFTLRVHPDRAPFLRWMMPGRALAVRTDAETSSD